MLIPPCLKRAALTLVAVAPRADDRFELSVLTVSVGRPRGVLVLAREGCDPMIEGEIVSERRSLAVCEPGSAILKTGVDT